MIRLDFSGDENTKGSAPALTFEQAANIVRTEPQNVRGSAPGLPLTPGQKPPAPLENEPGQPPLFDSA
jgi:hypothetical protein